MKKILFLSLLPAILLFAAPEDVAAQQYKLKQSTSVMGMKTETTIYVKGMRKRIETGSMMGMPPAPVVIEQCDLQRTVKLNDKKKLYFIIPFSKDQEEVIDEDIKTPPSKTKPVAPKTATQKGGTITMWYNITDTGERKKIHGFTARHIWTTQKIKPSADACSMKDSIIIKTDGWYIDLPQFNCPVRYKPSQMPRDPSERTKPDCMDRFITRKSGKGKLGFPLTETTTIIMGGSNPQMNQFQTNMETVELSQEKLDSMLFEIPPGYTLAANEEDLQDKFDMADMMKQVTNGDLSKMMPPVSEQKKVGTMRIGVYQPKSADQLPLSELQQNLVLLLRTDKIDAVAINSEEEAKKYNCDYLLNTEYTKIKQGSKVGGLLKAVKNADPNAATSFNIDAVFILTKFSDGSVFTQQNVSGKFEGKIEEASRKAAEDGGRKILKALN